MTLLRTIWARVWPYIATVAAAFAAFFTIRQAGRQAGRDEERRRLDEINRKAAERARHVENETAAMDDDAIARELVRDWVRGSAKR